MSDELDLGDDDLVRQAQELVSVQASCTLNEALVKMQNRAAATDETLEVVANYVLNGEIRLS
jgi:AmiR/NasT family two-component response regulator